MLNKKEEAVDFNKILKDSGFKITPTRLSVLEIFSKFDKPISADFIYKKLKGGINQATVFRALSSFEKSGILKKVDLRRESICFEFNNDHHHHMVCTKCGLIEDFKESNDIEKLLNQIVEKSTKFKNIQEHSLELFGVCKICK